LKDFSLDIKFNFKETDDIEARNRAFKLLEIIREVTSEHNISDVKLRELFDSAPPRKVDFKYKSSCIGIENK
jgi:hypothetical protein